ncbi:hypothetical protein SAMN04487949_0398 [Halogranum gelatinilyticum]|uniref:Uncharacterized protein n=1 Tax=Halogranum gelatinilyticum TaxID=660521 RepID=A0A1G9PHV5_9EURY|nr:hypothetical protein SAMN04487949_0398 [Halogranum gelatinilyticum]
MCPVSDRFALKTTLAGVQATLLGVLFVTFFESVFPLPLVGFVLGIFGTGLFVLGIRAG